MARFAFTTHWMTTGARTSSWRTPLSRGPQSGSTATSAGCSTRTTTGLGPKRRTLAGSSNIPKSTRWSNHVSEQENPRPPSLLDSQARGGDTAAAGFAFQEGVALALLPSWLAQEGFSQMICEAIGDIEVQFFNPGTIPAIELIEVKDHTVPPAEFWREVDRFRQLESGCSGTYRRFRLVAPDLSAELKPVANALRRVRDAFPFYQHDQYINRHSFQDWVQLIESKNHSRDDAYFLFDLVIINTSLASAARDAEALFRQALIKHFPEYDQLPGRVIGEIYKEFAQLLGSRRNKAITRLELEGLARASHPGGAWPTARPVWLHTSTESPTEDSTTAIRFDWAPFFGGTGRDYPPPEDWNERVVRELERARKWIQSQRLIRRVYLTGNRRLSAALAIGATFSAVAGFAIETEYRGHIWATDDHPGADTLDYALELEPLVAAGEHLVVSIGITREI